jgi:cardiolipin-specific phospholipase
MVDWMDYRNAEEAIKSMSVPAKVIRIPNSGHHLYLDNVEDFNQKLVDEVQQCADSI